MRGGPVPVEDQCRVFWGSHGCHKRRGHQGHHRCDHGCQWPETIEGIIYFGEDAPVELPSPQTSKEILAAIARSDARILKGDPSL